MAAVIQTLRGRGGHECLFALCALVGLLAAALLTLAPAAADGELDQFELVLSVADDSDNIVPAGSEIEVRAALRFPWELPITSPAGLPSYTPYALAAPQAAGLRVSGNLEWESALRQRLEIPTQTPIESTRLLVPPGDATQITIKAFDKRTLVLRSTNRPIYIFDSYTLEHKATLDPPAGTYSGQHRQNRSFGASVAWNPDNNYPGGWYGKAIDVWHETDDRAWLFIGSWGDSNFTGRLLRYRLDWDDDGVTVTPQGFLTPPLTETNNRWGSTPYAHYGGAVAFSRDGSTLAVSAPRMNAMGAVYVYSRPDGEGEDWGDLEYDDGVKVTVGAVPSLGTNAATLPFNPGVAYDASTPRSCDAWCSMVWSSIATSGYDGVDLGSNRVSLSADGSVLVVGAGEKEYAVTTPGGGFTNANRRNNAGEAFVFLAPEGGWRNAPRADQDADGNAKMPIAAKADASSFRRATHYSPGPPRRVTEPAAVLVAGAWPNPGNNFFGLDVVVSQDGSTVAVANSISAVYVFQRDSAGDWASLDGGYMTPSATLSGLIDPDEATMYFSLDGSELAIGLPEYPGGGAIRVFSRPADGTWVSAGAAAARLLREAEGVRSSGSRYGNVTPELSGTRAALGTQARHREYLNSPVVRGCAISVVDGVRTASCPLTLPGSTIVIPQGTPDGNFTISGSVTLRLGESGDPVATLSDALELTIGDVDELADIEFGFATDASSGQPQPAVVGPGGSTTLLLKLLNENGKASARGAAVSVLFTTNLGSLSARLGDASGEACGADGGSACRIADAATALTGANSDQVRLTVSHPGAGKAGAAQVRAVVVGAAGETFASEPLTVTFSGPPTALAITEPATALLGHRTSSPEDLRHQTTLVVSAADAGGNKATVPTSRYSAKLTNSDGKALTNQQAELVWPLRNSGGDLVLRDGNPQARVTIAADASTPLAAGEYKLELSAGSGANKLTATQTVTVAGGASEVSLSVDPPGAVQEGAPVVITATVSDASGKAVPDGTPVRFTEHSTDADNVALVLVSQSLQRTLNGHAVARLQAVGVGGAYVTAEADGVSGARPITVTAPQTEPEPLARLRVDAFTVWDMQTTSAAELLPTQPGVARVLKWFANEWVSYGIADGRRLPGSVDFIIERGDILWLSSE